MSDKTTQPTNLILWDSVKTTDPKYTKEAKIGGMKITAISAQYQRFLATEKFGPFGIGWGVESEEWSYMDFDNGTKLANYSAQFWYELDGKRGQFPINASIKTCYITNSGNGYLSVDDEFTKKASTNALTKGLSFLGFNADVFMGMFDDDKYVAMQTEAHAEPVVELTPSDKAERMAELKSELSWMEITWPWSKPEECAKKPLSDLAANANVDALNKMHGHFKDLITDKTPALVKYVEKVGMALTEAESTEELTGKDNGAVK